MAEKVKKPIYKKWWAWLIAGFLVFNIIGIITVDTDAEETESEKEDKPKEEMEIVTEDGENLVADKLEGEELEANQRERIRERFAEVVEKSEGVLIDIDFDNRKEDGNQMKVVVSDAWYSSPPHEQERFADTMSDTVKGIVWDVGLQERGSVMVVHIYDGHDKRVAKQSMVSGKYKIED